MLGLFRTARKSRQHNEEAGWLSPQPGGQLLQSPYRQQLIGALWDMCSMSRQVFVDYVQAPIERYAGLVQELPASESHHHAYRGGMLDHGLEVVCYAMRLRRQHLLPPGASPEEQTAVGELWTVAILYAALLHDVAKILVDIEIHLISGRRWHLWHGPIPEPYRVRYREDRDYHLHETTNLLLAQRIMSPNALDWLYSEPRLFGTMMYAVSGVPERGGIISEIVGQADRTSVSKALGGDPSKAYEAPTQSLQRKLADGLRYLVKEKLGINQPGAPLYLTEDALWLVSPRVPRELKGYLLENGVGGIPGSDTRLYDEMQAHGLIEANPQGQSVWPVTIAKDDWSVDLSCLRVPLALIWPTPEERPEPWSGTLTVREKASKKGKKDQAEAATPAPVDTAPAATGTTPPSLPSSAESSATPATDAPEQGTSTSATEVPGLDTDSLIDLVTGGETANATTPVADAQAADPSPVAATHDGASSPQRTKDEDTTTSQPAPTTKGKTLGETFLQWLQDGAKSHRLLVNAPKAQVHGVDDTWLIVSPGIFRRFCHEHDGVSWTEVQQQFQKLGLHRVRDDGTNIHSARVDGQNKKGRLVKGYILKRADVLPVEQRNNPFLSLIEHRNMDVNDAKRSE
ncbi:MobH family relaxase [Halomonas sabkhae]|uniref:MobH family relaxase n=1 Tax=Halomonas sabkhae TaxID=626223 RepID=UPI0025B5CD2A|nr:MobH family relaxase [Halomonas sabkhae]MDN3525268.1 MobH family relaxase [Halomonas sabkhae]